MELDVTLRKGFRLGNWEIRPIEGLVTGPQGSRHLQPKTIDVLVSLAASQGQVVTRDELISRVWGNNAVSDEPLTRCIHEIRRALDDHREQPTYIQTIPKRGYRLLETVESPASLSRRPQSTATPHDNLFWQITRQRVLWVGACYAGLAWVFVRLARYAEDAAAADQLPPEWLLPALTFTLLLGFPVAVFFAWVKQIRFDSAVSAGFPGLVPLFWSRRGIDIVAVTAMLSLLAGLAFDILPPGLAKGSGAEHLSIAVVPFANDSEVGEGNWLGAGIADGLRHRLASLRSLSVSSRKVSADDELLQLDVQQIGRELNVDYLLQGWVIRLPDKSSGGSGKIRIRATLLDAVTGFEIWSRSFSRDATALLDVQQDISVEIAAELGLAHLPDEAYEAPQEILNIQAYDNYLRGLDQLHKANSPDAAALAALHFSAAIKADARMAMARNGLCRAHVRELEFGTSDSLYDAANQVCAEALLQNPDSPAAHLALGDFYRITGYPEQAATEYVWVTERHPTGVEAWLGLARVYAETSRGSDAERAFASALVLQPDNADAQEFLTRFLLTDGRYIEAVEAARKLVQLDRGRVQAYDYLATALFMTGEFEASIQASRQVISLDPDRTSAAQNIAQNYYYLEDYGRAIAIYRQATRLQPGDHVLLGQLGAAYARLTDPEAQVQAAHAFTRARLLAQLSLRLSPTASFTSARLAYYCAALGDDSAAVAYLSDALSIGADSVEVQYVAALVYTQLGDLTAASVAAERALQLGYPRILVITDPLLAQSWSERQFFTAGLSALLPRSVR